MLIALYTSRVILQKLGVTDYGIYQSVGGMVGFLSFINNALSTGSSRFLTFELGKGNADKLKRTFSTVLTVHILLALIIVIIAETLGLWFVSNKLVIPQERLNAAIIAYHISVFASVFSLTQVPYNASIISHEKMSVYAYVSIYEVSMKLLICYLIGINEWDRLILYAVLIFFVNVSIMIFYRFYCNNHFKETKYLFILDRKIFKNVASFSGWSLFANGS
ncbi:MAG: MATE family efflux transporter, partial [Eubacteriales bacterium]